MELKGSKTEANLMAAFAGESQARNKYTFYAAKARKDGFEQIADIFDQTAKNEMAHAKIWFKILHNNTIPMTIDNLKDGAAGEHYEWSEMYADFAKVAKEEGFTKIAFLFEGVAKIEKAHEERYNTLAGNVESSHVFAKDQEVAWICGNCGYVYYGKEAPGVCPICEHPQSFFQEEAKNYQ